MLPDDQADATAKESSAVQTIRNMRDRVILTIFHRRLHDITT
jgi:hypothetical protein